MSSESQLLDAIILTFFVSRATLRLPNPFRKAAGIAAAHLASLLAILGLVLAVRGPVGIFSPEQMFIYLSPQVLWCLLDLLREHRLGLNRTAQKSG